MESFQLPWSCQARFTAKSAKSAKKDHRPAHNRLTMRLMPSLMRTTVQFTRKPSRSEIHRQGAKSAKKDHRPAHNRLTMRLMPSLMRTTVQFTRKKHVDAITDLNFDLAVHYGKGNFRDDLDARQRSSCARHA